MIDLTERKVLVTGGCGMIGIQLATQLADVENAVVYVTDLQEKKPKELESISYHRADLNDPEQAAMVFALVRPDYVFHLAGAKGGTGIGRTKSLTFLLANLRCTMNVVNASIGSAKRLLFTSSVGAYPGSKSLFKESDAWAGDPHPSDYWGGWSKRYGELMCRAAAEQYEFDFVAVRPTNVFGPHDRFDVETGMVIPALITRLEDGENPLVLRCNKNAMRDFLYAGECARGMIAAMKNGERGEIYNLGVGSPVYVARIAEILCGIYGVKLEVNHVEDGAPQIRCMDMAKSKDQLGFYPPPNGAINKQLKDTVAWYKANKGLVKFDPFKESVA